MPGAFDKATDNVARMVAEFVEAADNLVNLLATEHQGTDQAVVVHKASLDRAYDRYDQARAALVGDPASE
jgi:hypothetical protein